MKLNVSIGILAHNESAAIAKTLHSLLEQSLFEEAPMLVEIVVVPNGCSDDTALVASRTLEEAIAARNNKGDKGDKGDRPDIRWRVCEVERPGKCNAWNRYVSDFSDRAADYLILMDADIQFLERHTLRNLIDILEKNTDAWASVDSPVKDVALKENKTPMEWLSVLVSKAGSKPDNPGICGQLYCGRGDIFRRICLPEVMQVEDGFLAAMIRSNCFTSPELGERIVLALEASHSFEAHTDLNRLLRHERWLVLSNAIDSFVYSDLWANCNSDADAGTLIRRRNEENPLWLQQTIADAIAKKGWWLLPDWMLFRRFRSLQRHPPLKSVLLFPIAAIAFLADLLVFLQANQELHRGGGTSYWGKTQNSSFNAEKAWKPR